MGQCPCANFRAEECTKLLFHDLVRSNWKLGKQLFY